MITSSSDTFSSAGAAVIARTSNTASSKPPIDMRGSGRVANGQYPIDTLGIGRGCQVERCPQRDVPEIYGPATAGIRQHIRCAIQMNRWKISLPRPQTDIDKLGMLATTAGRYQLAAGVAKIGHPPA
jgi:hypothetical protein